MLVSSLINRGTVSRERDLGFKLEESRDFRNGTKMRERGFCPEEKYETIHSLA